MGYTNLPPQVNGAGWFGGLLGLSRMVAGLVLATGLSTCGPDSTCLKSTGSIITERREVAPGLTHIVMFDNVDLRLVQDSLTYAEVRAGKNLIGDIGFNRQGYTLEISNSSTCNWLRSYNTPREVTLHLPRFRKILILGYGNVSTVGQFALDTVYFDLNGRGNFDLNVKARQLFIDQDDVGDVTVRGEATQLGLFLAGAGQLFAQGLATERCYFDLTRESYGSAYVRSSGNLGGRLKGEGSLYYSGSPSYIDIVVTGKGRVVPQ
ncbi:GIN domain-containing protein [Hymenobacter arizonensis]|nr:DUF2807 domain-containing protein [Hymenobacter arizonensis]